MMITAEMLPEAAARGWPFGEAEIQTIKRPRAARWMPQEWGDKLGIHKLPQPYVYELLDVHLCGPGMIGIAPAIDGDGMDVVLDVGYYGRIDLWERNKAYFDWARLALNDYQADIIPCAISLGGVWSGNYFHWVLDSLPKLAAAKVYAKETGVKPVVIVGPNPAPFVRDWLDMVGLAWLSGKQHYLVERLVAPTQIRYNGLVYEWAAAWLRDLGAKALAKYDTERNGGGSRKIYISRKDAKTRRVQNENDILDRLSLRGFDCVLPGKYSALEQVSRFSKADVVIGPHGAGLVNALWMRRGVVVELVAPQYTNPCIWLAGQAAGLDYRFILGDGVGKEDLTLNLDDYSLLLEHLEAACIA